MLYAVPTAAAGGSTPRLASDVTIHLPGSVFIRASGPHRLDRGLREQDEELLAAEPAGEVAGSQCGLDGCADGSKHFVSLGVPVEIVDRLVVVALERDPEAAIALSLVLLVVSVAVLVGLRDRWLNTGAAA